MFYYNSFFILFVLIIIIMQCCYVNHIYVTILLQPVYYRINKLLCTRLRICTIVTKEKRAHVCVVISGRGLRSGLPHPGRSVSEQRHQKH